MNSLPLPPGLILILGALLIPFLRGWAKSAYVVILPAIGFLNLICLASSFAVGGEEQVVRWTFQFMDFELVFGRIDKFSLLFGHIFSLLAVVAFIFILHTRDDLEYMSGMVYAGSALGVVFAGDLVTLFVFWEMLTLCAVGCALARRTAEARGAAFRYLVFHVAGGVILMAGIVVHVVQTGSAQVAPIGLDSPGAWLIFLGFGVNCAWPLLHAWLPDAYSKAGIGGVVFMATFTTKTAVYTLARTFPGESSLIYIGVAMVILPLFWAMIENDLRKTLAYCLINQVGFMVVGVGIGTDLALNGTGAHAYCHILYKALLFMSIGAVMHRTGKSKATELGGLFRSMPLTCLLCCIGAAASSFPFFGSFVAKSMIVSAAAESHHTFAWLALLFGAAGVFHLVGLKIPYFAFFSRDSGIRVKEAPTNMLVAMGMIAVLCFTIALPVVNLPWVGYRYLYGLLPFELEHAYEPYTFAHVNAQMLLLVFAALAFALSLLAGRYPSEQRSENLDADFIYRSGGVAMLRFLDRRLNAMNASAKRLVVDGVVAKLARLCAAGPTWLVAQAMKSVWEVQRLDPKTLAAKEADLYRRAQEGAVPIGVSALIAAMMMAILLIV